MDTTLITIHYCDNILDALYIKNEIQRVTSISVILNKEQGNVKVQVCKSNQYRANVIIQNKLQRLPSLSY
ncbi:hypothetical protein [Ochrovirga pacifica]|uniref:hypothetical protein n=1 Tax=Ochrovirga pacifica TaxID=1042376 RepID=UPI0002559DD6|nr:hypothetical protein [Ochrovirga pacifica]